jgi:hypothetical protein
MGVVGCACGQGAGAACGSEQERAPKKMQGPQNNALLSTFWGPLPEAIESDSAHFLKAFNTMKSATILLATAVAAEQPVITLNLAESTEGVTFAHTSAHWNGPTNTVNNNAGVAQGAVAGVYPGSTNTATAAQTVTCLVGEDATQCPTPTVKAWDHHDGDISSTITQCFRLINIGRANQANQAEAGACQATHDANMRNFRSEWIFTYDVTDRAGNAATTVTFSMVFVDNAPPAFTLNDQTSTQTSEARDLSVTDQCKFDRNLKRQKLNFKSIDVYDGDLTDQASITYTAPSTAAVTFLKSSTTLPAHHPNGLNTDTYYDVDTSDLGNHVFAIAANDHAGIFGTAGVNNPSSFSWTLTVQDLTAPIITCTAAYCKEVFASTGAAIANTVSTSTDTWAGDARTYVSFEAAATDDATCCTACQTQARSRVIGTIAADGPASCTHYTFSGSTCSLFSGAVGAYGGSTKVGMPMACNHGDENWECGPTFTDYGAWCTDIYDGYSIDAVSSIAATTGSGSPTGGVKGVSSIDYTCTDSNNVAATAVTRTTSVRDTTPPTLAITTAGSHTVGAGITNTEDRLARYAKFGNAGRHAGSLGATADDLATTLGAGSANYGVHTEAQLHGHALDSHVIQHSAGYLKDLAIIQNLRTLNVGMTCVDACDATASVATSWNPTFNNIVPGTYVLKYTCSDISGHETIKERTVINEDKTKPVIRILGQDLMTLEATHDGNYVDDGATCSDQVDGMISENVEVSGDVVNLSTRGMYTISYNCKDSAGNAADTAIRIVYVVQTSCPTCMINGATELSREASFPYVDAGATCTDLLDATVPTGTTVNNVNVETTGTYKITYRVANVLGLYNDESTCRYGKMTYTRTVHVIDTLNPVITLKYNSVVVKSGLANDMALQSHASSPDLSAQINPADTNNNAHNSIYDADPRVNPQFMAETAQAASVNGWVVGAVGSAVTGLALLGYSMRKTSVATSVPV